MVKYDFETFEFIRNYRGKDETYWYLSGSDGEELENDNSALNYIQDKGWEVLGWTMRRERLSCSMGSAGHVFILAVQARRAKGMASGVRTVGEA